MEKSIYRQYVELEVIQRVVIFAKVFGLNIVDWNSRGPINHPTRIYLFTDQGRTQMAGFIDYQDIEKFSLVLFSPIGKIEGHLNTHSNYINYGVNVVGQEHYDRIEGFYSTIPSSYPQGKYSSESTLTVKKNGNTVYNFQCLNQSSYFVLENIFNYEQLLYKNSPIASGAISIWHFKGIENHRMRRVAAICQDGYGLEHNGDIRLQFPLLGKVGYTLPNNKPSNESGTGLEVVNFAQINEEIAKYDPRLFEFVDESRRFLTLPELALYDQVVTSTIGCLMPRLTEKIARTPYQPFSVEDNPLVLRLNGQKRRNIYG